jgi:hypothetical protein
VPSLTSTLGRRSSHPREKTHGSESTPLDRLHGPPPKKNKLLCKKSKGLPVQATLFQLLTSDKDPLRNQAEKSCSPGRDLA